MDVSSTRLTMERLVRGLVWLGVLTLLTRRHLHQRNTGRTSVRTHRESIASTARQPLSINQNY